jgi:hypothetical protein
MDPAQYGGGARLSGAAFGARELWSGRAAYSLGARTRGRAFRDHVGGGATGRGSYKPPIVDRRAGHGCSRSSWSAPVRGLLGSRAERRSRPPSSRARTTWRSGQSSRNANTNSRSPGSPGRSVASPTPSAVAPREAADARPVSAPSVSSRIRADPPPPQAGEDDGSPSSPVQRGRWREAKPRDGGGALTPQQENPRCPSPNRPAGVVGAI